MYTNTQVSSAQEVFSFFLSLSFFVFLFPTFSFLLLNRLFYTFWLKSKNINKTGHNNNNNNGYEVFVLI